MPVPTHVGKPTREYLFPWAICNFFNGKNPNPKNNLQQDQSTLGLANFINAMQGIDTARAPKCGRGQHIKQRDNAVRKSIPLLPGQYDTKLLTEIWDEVVNTKEWYSSPAWIQGDLHSGKILVKKGKISVIVDFGLCGVGDPSCDYMAAWMLLNQNSCSKFRSLVNADDN